MNRLLSLTLALGLGVAAAQSALPGALPATTAVQTPDATTDPSLSATLTTVQAASFRGPLSALLQSVAQSAGYEVIFDGDVDKAERSLNYNLYKKPFNQVWPLLMELNGLDYRQARLGGKTVLRVSATPVQELVNVRTPSAELLKSLGELPGVKVVAVEASGQLLITGARADVTRARLLINDVDQAAFLRQKRQELNQGAAQAAQALSQQVYVVKSDFVEVSAALREQFPGVTVTSLPSSRQLVLRGTPELVQGALTLLAQVDVAPPAPAPSPLDPQGERLYQVLGQQADALKLLEARFPDLKVLAIGTTGQLILTGAESRLSAALNLLALVDKIPTPPATVVRDPVIQQIFTLTNASAEDLKATIEGALSRDLTAAKSTTDASQAKDDQVSQVIKEAPNQVLIIADKRTNTLVARGTVEQVKQVADMIAAMDKRVPQVKVKVQIREISETARKNLGLNWSVMAGGFSLGSSDSRGLSASFNPLATSVGFNILPSLEAFEAQGLSKRIYDGTVTMQSGQRALANTSGSSSDSQNAAASIKSGGRLEINVPSSAGNIEKQIDYGVILDFFEPQIDNEGNLTLRVRSKVTGEPVIPDNGLPQLLRYTNSEVQSTITVRDGETVLLGGMLSNVAGNDNAGTPFLSSLPVVGALFGKQTGKKEKTELVVVVTSETLK